MTHSVTHGQTIASKHEYAAGILNWRHRNDPGDIVSYQVLSVPEDVAA